MQLRDRTAGFVRTEGGLLPPDLLERIRSLDGQLPFLDPASYGLERSDRFGEAITRSWNRLVGAWAAFTDELGALPESDPATSPTRERWLLPLFEELGYGRLSPAKAVEIDGKSYPVSHARGTIPLHLVGANVPLDRRSRGVAGAATQSPHGLLQEFLNRTSDRLWGVVSNGRTLRLLRDNASLTRQAYVEFDLEAIFSAEAYADFALLWHLAHHSRLEARPADGAEEGASPTAHGAVLERWSKIAADTGARARDRLRDGVQEAIEVLGSGFLGHAANGELRAALQAGELDTQDYYRQLLRLVYRLILLFVAEDRDLLLDPKADAPTRERYTRYYSTARLRRLAGRRKGTRHADLYAGLRVVIAALGRDDGAPGIGLPPLGGFLFGPDACPHLDGAELANVNLLDAIRKLATIEERGVLRAVDYRNLGSEELGSIYESLLELHPELDVNAGSLALRTAAGHERKTTGSYYTPSPLISVLLNSALDPVLDQAATKPTPEEAERAILELSIVDPAAGSGHFLVAAAHRIAKRLASVRSGDEEPAPEAIRTALRDVIGHCLYAVDINPMAVELCKVSLWLEALEPGKPLTFLDAHIKCGNSLLGTTPELVAQGIPDAAYTPIEGDDKKVAAALKKQNRAEREGQLSLGEAGLEQSVRNIAYEFEELEHLADRTIAEVRAKEDALRQSEGSEALRRLKLAADSWCAAFVVPKTDVVTWLTTRSVRRAAAGTVDEAVKTATHEAAAQLRFFHWFLEFPQVMETGGFNVVLGNPPWAALSPDRAEFFAQYGLQVRSASKVEQERLMAELLEDDEVAQLWEEYRLRLFALVKFLKHSGRYTLFAPGNLGKGDFNIYRMFVELALRITRNGGRASQVVPGGLYAGANASAIRRYLIEQCRLLRLLGFDNQQRQWFDVSVNAFSIYAAEVGRTTTTFEAIFGLASTEQLGGLERLMMPIDADDLRRRAPDTLALEEFSNATEMRILTKMQQAWPPFGDTSGRLRRDFLAEVHMGNDRDRFNSDGGLPVYEGRMIDRYDYRAKRYREGHGNSAKWDPQPWASAKIIRPQWYITRQMIPTKVGSRPYRYRLAYADIADPRTARSVVSTLIPPGTICGHATPTIVFDEGDEWGYPLFLAVANSLCFDFLARTRLSGKHLTFTIMDSLPFPRLAPDSALCRALTERTLRLMCTGPELDDFWVLIRAYGWTPEKPIARGVTDPDARALIEAEIDVLVARHAYGLTNEELLYIVDSFDTLQREEKRVYDEFRTRRLVWEALSNLEFRDAYSDPKRQPQPATISSVSESDPHSQPQVSRVHASEPPMPSRPANLLPSEVDAAGWQAESGVAPEDLVVGLEVRHRSYGPGLVLSVRRNGRTTSLLIRFASGEREIGFGYGVLDFRSQVRDAP